MHPRDTVVGKKVSQLEERQQHDTVLVTLCDFQRLGKKKSKQPFLRWLNDRLCDSELVQPEL